MLPPVFGVLFDGFAYGMLLFLLSVGLSVTLGLMNFVNLAHCAFAMLGGYVTVAADDTISAGRSSPRCRAPSSPPPWSASAFERVLYRPALPRSDLDQVLLTIGIAFISVAVAAYVLRHRSSSRSDCRTICAARSTVLGLDIAVYRLFLIASALADHAAPGRHARIHALRRAGARGGRQPAHGERARHQCRAHLRRHLRARQRARRARRRARDRDRRARSEFRLHLSRLCADRGVGRRARLDRRLVRRRGAADRHQRHRRQILRAAARRLPHLSGHDRAC